MNKIQNEIRSDIESIKGFAIILVVFGHVYYHNVPLGYTYIRTFIYSFHMPLFMFVSGFLAYISMANIKQESFFNFALRRFDRLLVPFFIIAIFVASAKYIFGQYMNVNKQVNELEDFFRIVYNTERSPALFVWYLFVVFVYSIFVRLVSSIKYFIVFNIILGIILHAIWLYTRFNSINIDYLYIDRICMYYIFFSIGLMAAKYNKIWIKIASLLIIPCCLTFVYIMMNPLGSDVRYIVVGPAAILIFSFIFYSYDSNVSYYLNKIGEHTLVIYLLNMFFIGIYINIIHIIFGVNYIGWTHIFFITVIGCAGPVVVKYIIRDIFRIRSVSRYLS